MTGPLTIRDMSPAVFFGLNGKMVSPIEKALVEARRGLGSSGLETD
jgi:hypothetical protein